MSHSNNAAVWSTLNIKLNTFVKKSIEAWASSDTGSWLLIQDLDYWYSILITDTVSWLIFRVTGTTVKSTEDQQYLASWMFRGGTSNDRTRRKIAIYRNPSHTAVGCICWLYHTQVMMQGKIFSTKSLAWVGSLLLILFSIRCGQNCRITVMNWFGPLLTSDSIRFIIANIQLRLESSV